MSESLASSSVASDGSDHHTFEWMVPAASLSFRLDDPTLTPATCARRCGWLIQTIQNTRNHGMVGPPPSAEQLFQQIMELLGDKFVSWSGQAAVKGGAKSVVDALVCAWCHLFWVFSPEFWREPPPSHEGCRKLLLQMREALEQWHQAQAHPGLGTRVTQLLAQSAHAVCTTLSQWQDTGEPAPQKAELAAISREEMKNRITDEDVIQGAQDEETAQEEPEALCVYRFIETLGRLWFLNYYYDFVEQYHTNPVTAVCLPVRASKAAQTRALSLARELVRFESSEFGDSYYREAVCNWHCPALARLMTKRTVTEGWPHVQGSALMRKELGVKRASQVISDSAASPMHCLDEVTSPEQLAELTPVQQVWMLLGLNRWWAASTGDRTGREFLDCYVVMEHDVVQRQSLWQTQYRYGRLRLPLLLRLKGVWGVQVPVAQSSPRWYPCPEGLAHAIVVWAWMVKYIKAYHHKTETDKSTKHITSKILGV